MVTRKYRFSKKKHNGLIVGMRGYGDISIQYRYVRHDTYRGPARYIAIRPWHSLSFVVTALLLFFQYSTGKNFFLKSLIFWFLVFTIFHVSTFNTNQFLFCKMPVIFQSYFLQHVVNPKNLMYILQQYFYISWNCHIIHVNNRCKYRS